MRIKNIIDCTLKTGFTIALLLTALTATAQTRPDGHLWMNSKIVDYTSDKLHRTKELIDSKLDLKDSLYVAPNLYNMTIMTQYSYNYEYYRFNSINDKQSLKITPESNNKVGLYVGWKWIFLGWSFDLTNNSSKRDINLSFYTAKLGIDIFYRRRDKGFEISSTQGFYDSTGREIRRRNSHFNGLSTMQDGVNIYYIFNNKRFSYPAAYSQSTTQRISAGSFILGLSYNEQSFTFDYSKLDKELLSSILPELMFKKVKYKDYSINFGYSYNWVFKKNCLANISFTPAIGYKNSSLRLKDSKEFMSNINFDVITRAAIVYNNRNYYVGASLVSHTYSYHKSTLSIINGFGVINLYTGFNFWRKKH